MMRLTLEMVSEVYDHATIAGCEDIAERAKYWGRYGTAAAAAAKLGVDRSTVTKSVRRYYDLIVSTAPTPEAAPPDLLDAIDLPSVAPPRRPGDTEPSVSAPADPVELRRAKAAQKRAEDDAKNVVEQLVALQDRVALFDDLTGKPLPPITRRETASGAREATAVALFSDWHVETLVRPHDTPTGNTYTLGIADSRIQRAFDAILWLTEKESDKARIDNLVLWLGGDFITNHLHPENVETAQLGPAGALLWVQSRIVAGVKRILESDLFETVLIPCSYGNHGRTTDRMRATTSAQHSWEWIMYQAIAYEFRDDPRVRVLADESAHQYVQIYDFTAHFHHGHDIKYGGGIGGIAIPINKAVSRWNMVRRADFHNFGHFHQYSAPGNGVNVNGSLIGYDGYAMTFGASPEPPRQSFYLVDSKRGQTACSPIWVDDAVAEAAEWQRVCRLYAR